MTVFIRSQDKRTLEQYTRLSVGKLDDCNFNFKFYYRERQETEDFDNEWCIINDREEAVGFYSTEQRCIEIIDEIQDALCGNFWKYKGTGFVDRVTIEPLGENVVAVVNKEIIELPNQKTFVYEMPKE